MLQRIKSERDVGLYSPNISVKRRHKKITITGQSRMSDPAEYYTQLSQELEDYFHLFKDTLFVDFHLDYLNTGSSKWLYFMLTHLQKIQSSKGMIEVTWMYEQDDETIEESGEILQSLVSFPFRLIPT